MYSRDSITRWKLMIKLCLPVFLGLLALKHISEMFGSDTVSIFITTETVEAFQQRALPINSIGHINYGLLPVTPVTVDSCFALNEPFYCTRRRYDSLTFQHLKRRGRYHMGMITNDDALTAANNNSSVLENLDVGQVEKSYASVDDGSATSTTTGSTGANHFFDRAILNHKLLGLQLSDQKLLVLQDAAKRMVQRHETQMKDAHQHHSSNLAATIEERNVQHSREMEILNKTMERRLRQIEVDRNKVINELKKTKHEYENLLDVERKSASEQLIEISSKYKQDHTIWIDDVHRLRHDLAMMERHAQSAARDANNTIHNVEIKSRLESEKYQSLQSKYEYRKERYHQAMTEIEELRGELSELKLERLTLKETEVKVQLQYKDQMEIAESAVAAATKREGVLQTRYDSIQQTNNNLQIEVSKLKDQLQQKLDGYNELEKVLVAANATRTSKNSTILSHFRQRIGKYRYMWNNDQSILRLSCRWIQYAFMPRILPIQAIQRRRKDTKS